MNKLVIMLPMMYAVRKLDGEDPNVVFMLRCAYGVVQGLILLAVLYIYMVAKKISESKVKDEEIYAAAPPSVSICVYVFSGISTGFFMCETGKGEKSK